MKARTTMLNHLNQDNDDDSFPMVPQRVLSDVRKVMKGNDIVLSDVGAHKMWVAREYNCTEPNTCLISTDFVQWFSFTWFNGCQNGIS